MANEEWDADGRGWTRRTERQNIDVEYMGWEAQIKNTLVAYLQRDDPRFDPTRILFQHIGKKSAAHHRAIKVARRRRTPNKRISEAEFLGLLSKRK